MADYFEGGATATATTAPPTNGDAPMDDEIMVRILAISIPTFTNQYPVSF